VFRLRGDITQYFDMHGITNPFGPLLNAGADLMHMMRETLQRVSYAASTSGTLADRAVQISEFTQWLDYSPIQRLLENSIDTRKIAVSDRKLRITAVNWLTGIPKVFTNQEIGSPDGRQAILAAMALPGIFPAMAVDGIPYVDSSVLIQTPLKPAIDARSINTEASVVLHVIYADASFREIPVPPLSNTFSTVYRLYQLALSGAINTDMARARLVNERIRIRDLFETVATQGEPGKQREQLLQEKFGEDVTPLLEQLHDDLRNKVRITVHKYAPREHLYGFELLQFERKSVEKIIQHGDDAARDHDCQASGCIIPEENQPPLF
jgi:predicted acylesterase/phospholipase RssA